MESNSLTETNNDLEGLQSPENLSNELNTTETIQTPSSSGMTTMKEKKLSLKRKNPSSEIFISSPFVRIDNFQRPLHLKGLISWINEICDFQINEDDIWINFIKTHCYLDCHSVEQASQCISKLNGLKYPLTSKILLEVNYTKVSPQEAPHHTEASLKPGEWLKSNDPSSNNQDTKKIKTEEVPVKKSLKLDLKLFQKSTENTFQTNSKPEIAHIRTPLKLKMSNDDVLKDNVELLEDQEKVKSLSVDKFNMTITEPSIRWQPAPTEIIEKRLALKLRLGKK